MTEWLFMWYNALGGNIMSLYSESGLQMLTEHRLTQYRASIKAMFSRKRVKREKCLKMKKISKAHPVAQRITIPSVEYI